jgi:hypothetical protein
MTDRLLSNRFVAIISLVLFLCPAVSFAAQSQTNSFAGQILSNNATGRVGIGTTVPAATLDVYQGEIKIGSTGAACNASLSGALRSAGATLHRMNK